MATQITQMCGIVYPVFAFTHCRDVVSIDFQKWGYLTGLTFTPDGNTMFVETAQPATGDPTGPPTKGAGKIMRVSADGVVAEELPVVTGLDQPCSMLFAPKGFIRTVDSCLWLIGELTLIASGFANPTGVAFPGHRLMLSDINGDFHVGQCELPDGLLIMITAQ